MRLLFSKPVVAICVAASLMGHHAAAADSVRAGGTGSAIGLLSQVGAAFTADSGVKLEVIPSLGSTGALRALTDGKLDLAVSARPLSAEEKAAGLRQVAVLRTPFVLATSKPDPDGLKTSDLLSDILGAETGLGRRQADAAHSAPAQRGRHRPAGRFVPRPGQSDRSLAPAPGRAGRGHRPGQRPCGGAHARLAHRNHAGASRRPKSPTCASCRSMA